MKKAQTGKKSLKWFLIQRFLYIMVFIFVSEELLKAGYRLWVVPFLTETMHVRLLSVTASDGSLLLLMLQMLLLSGAALLPDYLVGTVQRMIEKNIGLGLRVDIVSPVMDGAVDHRFVAVYQLAIVIIFFALLFITLLPYLLSSYWYYKAVSRKMQELLQEEKAQKEEYDRQKSLLLSDIAHDIKTPLTTVCGYAKALADDVVTGEEKRKEYLQAIVAKSMRMDELITLLFEYVKLDSSGFSLHKEKADLGELLRENVALLYQDMEERAMELEIEIPEEPFPLEMDKIQIGRAITNILTNAVKYNPQGTKIFAGIEHSSYRQYRIRIADNGEPIDEELAEHIFEPFTRGDQARSSGGGNGLGLSISFKIIQMHGGELRLERACTDGYEKAFVISFSVEG